MTNKRQDDDVETLTRRERFELEMHMRALGVTTVEAYRTWCEEHGFGPQLRKRPHQRRAEAALVRERGLDAAVERSKRARRNPIERIDEILAGEVEQGTPPQPPGRRGPRPMQRTRHAQGHGDPASMVPAGGADGALVHREGLTLTAESPRRFSLVGRRVSWPRRRRGIER